MWLYKGHTHTSTHKYELATVKRMRAPWSALTFLGSRCLVGFELLAGSHSWKGQTETHPHTHFCTSIFVRTTCDIMHLLSPFPYHIKPNLTLTLKPSLNPQTSILRCACVRVCVCVKRSENVTNSCKCTQSQG